MELAYNNEGANAMTKKTIYFGVIPGEAEGRWIAVNDQDITLTNDKGSISVDTGRSKHTLTWWFSGEEGTKLTIIGSLDEEGTQVVVKVESEVPEDERDGGGRRRFALSPKEKQ